MLHSKRCIAEARSWSLARAAQLIRNDIHPNRWVALHMNNRAWGMFWAGGGLQLCREHLASKANKDIECFALAPVKAEDILSLVLTTEVMDPTGGPSILTPRSRLSRDLQLIGITSAVWVSALMIIVAGFHHALDSRIRNLNSCLSE